MRNENAKGGYGGNPRGGDSRGGYGGDSRGGYGGDSRGGYGGNSRGGDSRGGYGGDSRGGYGGGAKPFKPQVQSVKEITPCEASVNVYKYMGKKVVLHHYAVSFVPEILQKIAFQKFMSMAEENKFTTPFCYDGDKMLVSSQKFPDTELKVPMRDGELRCRIEYKNTYDMGDPKVDRSMLVQCMEAVMRFYQRQVFYVDHKKIVSPDSQPHEIGGGLQIYPGLSDSIRFCNGNYYLNLDMAFCVFFKSSTLIDLIREISDKSGRRITGDAIPDLGEKFYMDLEKLLKNVRLTTNHRERNMTFKASGILYKPASSVTFETENGSMTVADYFAKTYKPLKYPHLPLIAIKRKEAVIYMPIEVLCIPAMQRYQKKLNEMMTSQMIRIAAKRPDERFSQIEEKAKELAILNNDNLKRFGIAFDNKMLNCKGKMLPPPKIEFKNSKKMDVNNGSWNLMGVKMLEEVTSFPEWCVFVFRGGRVGNDQIAGFTEHAENYGVKMGKPKMVNINTVEDFYKAPKCRFNLVVLPDKNAQRYEEIKRIAETYNSCFTQCIVAANAFKLTNPQFVGNLILKINTKLGGRNWKLEKRIMDDKPTIVFGIDVCHPGIGEMDSPSVCSVVASMDYDFVRYKTSILQQERYVEVVDSLEATVKSMLKSHYGYTHNKPSRIVIFRDGVGDSMFDIIYNNEITTIRKACDQLGADYKPEIVFIVAQKRHCIRFSARGQNLRPGTVIDDEQLCVKGEGKTGVSTANCEMDFFLVSHNAIQGTARPVRYLVLLNEAKFTSEKLQEIVYSMCHLYMRASKSVSVVPPIYYADLAAARGKCYFERNADGALIMRKCDPEIEKNLFYL